MITHDPSKSFIVLEGSTDIPDDIFDINITRLDQLRHSSDIDDDPDTLQEDHNVPIDDPDIEDDINDPSPNDFE